MWVIKTPAPELRAGMRWAGTPASASRPRCVKSAQPVVLESKLQSSGHDLTTEPALRDSLPCPGLLKGVTRQPLMASVLCFAFSNTSETFAIFYLFHLGYSLVVRTFSQVTTRLPSLGWGLEAQALGQLQLPVGNKAPRAVSLGGIEAQWGSSYPGGSLQGSGSNSNSQEGPFHAAGSCDTFGFLASGTAAAAGLEWPAWGPGTQTWNPLIVTPQGAVVRVAKMKTSGISASERAVLPLNPGFIFVPWIPWPLQVIISFIA